MSLYTAQFRYPGPNRLDITVKSGRGGKGEPFIPTWKMVMDWKNGKITNEKYTATYLNILSTKEDELSQLAIDCAINDIVLVCYCPWIGFETFCHRLILARYLEGMYYVDYAGELTGPNFTITKKEYLQP